MCRGLTEKRHFISTLKRLNTRDGIQLTWNQEIEYTKHDSHRVDIVADNWLILPHVTPGEHTKLNDI